MANEIEQKVLDFLKVAKTRGGVPFKAESFQRDAAGNLSTIKGTVTEIVGGEEVSQEMIWNINGIALISSVQLKHDLVEDVRIIPENTQE